MATKNKTRYAILGVLCMKPCTGYDIKKFCDKTISHFWNENFGHIYPVLKLLLEEHLIKPVGNETEERRKLYAITEAGKQEFKEWLVEAPQLQPPRSELLLKLSFGNHMQREDVTAMMKAVIERNTNHLKQYRAMEQAYLADEAAKKDPSYPYWLASLRLGIMNAGTAILWANDTLRLLDGFSQTTDTEAEV